MLTLPSQPTKILAFQRLPQPSSIHPFAVRITTMDGSLLPSEFKAPRSLSQLFEKYEPKAVAFNQSGFLRNNGVRFWWVSLPTLESLKRFVAEIDGLTLSGKILSVELTEVSIDRCQVKRIT
jgi:hypothetical protein